MRFLRWLGIGVLVLLGLFVISVIGARFADGPVAIFPGGPFTSGELVTDPDVDFTFAASIDEIEFELLDPPRSRTVWIVVRDGRAYVPCGFLSVPLWKQWPHEALEDGRALLRIDGKLYPVNAVRVTDPAVYAEVTGMVSKKYTGGRGAADPEQVWIFRMDPRPTG